MDPVLAFLAGMLQGATEWLPISSSGQVVLLLEGMGVDADDTLSLAFFLHFGTLFAVLARLRGDVNIEVARSRSDVDRQVCSLAELVGPVNPHVSGAVARQVPNVQQFRKLVGLLRPQLADDAFDYR